jgi:hypothetical protein
MPFLSRTASLDAPTGDTDSVLFDRLADSGPSPESIVVATNLSDTIRESMQGYLTAQEYQMVQMRLTGTEKKYSFDEIGEIVGRHGYTVAHDLHVIAAKLWHPQSPFRKLVIDSRLDIDYAHLQAAFGFKPSATLPSKPKGKGPRQEPGDTELESILFT